MNQEDIQKAFEAIGKSGINVAGDLVLEKKVEYEVNNVEAGGIGIQIKNGPEDTSDKDIKNETEGEQNVNQRVKKCIDVLNNEKLLKHLYDYTWVMETMNQTSGLPNFKSPQSFIKYLKGLGVERLPSEDSIDKKQNSFTGIFPDWEFIDCDFTETTRRINVGKRFLSIYRS